MSRRLEAFAPFSARLRSLVPVVTHSYNESLFFASPFLIQTHTDQLAGVIIQPPVAPTVLPERHTVSPHRKRGRACARPLGVALLAFASAVSSLVRPPRTAIFAVAQRHRDAVLQAILRSCCGSAAMPVPSGAARASQGRRSGASAGAAPPVGLCGSVASQPIQCHPWPHARMGFQNGSEGLKNGYM